MKLFNLEAAKRGEPVITIDGRPVKILTFDRKHLVNKIVYLVKTNEEEEVCMCDENGIHLDTLERGSGVNDSFGSEIFEGDVVHFGGKEYKVIFEDGCFWLSNDETTMELHTFIGMGEIKIKAIEE